MSQPETSSNNNSVNDEALDLADDDEAGPNNNVDTDLMVWSLRPKSGSSIKQLCPPLHIVQTACQRGQAVMRCHYSVPWCGQQTPELGVVMTWFSEIDLL